MSDLQKYLEEVKQRVEAATDGPWIWGVMKPDRLAMICFDRRLLLSGQFTRQLFHALLSSLPEDSAIVGFDFSFERNVASVIVRSEEFDEVPIAQRLPELEIKFYENNGIATATLIKEIEG